MKPIYINWDKKEQVLVCVHRKQFPPPQVHPDVVAEMGDIETQRANKTITGAKYQQIKVWERVCGLREMDVKCLSCVNCRIKTNHPTWGEQLRSLPSLLKKLNKLPK